jgi:hypothetical protein
MGVPPIEQHGGGGWRVGKRKIRSVRSRVFSQKYGGKHTKFFTSKVRKYAYVNPAG